MHTDIIEREYRKYKEKYLKYKSKYIQSAKTAGRIKLNFKTKKNDRDSLEYILNTHLSIGSCDVEKIVQNIDQTEKDDLTKLLKNQNLLKLISRITGCYNDKIMELNFDDYSDEEFLN